MASEKGKNEWIIHDDDGYLFKERKDNAVRREQKKKKWMSNTMPKQTCAPLPPPIKDLSCVCVCVCVQCVRDLFFVWRSECRHRLEMLIHTPPGHRSFLRLGIPSPLECTRRACAPRSPQTASPSFHRPGISMGLDRMGTGWWWCDPLLPCGVRVYASREKTFALPPIVVLFLFTEWTDST